MPRAESLDVDACPGASPVRLHREINGGVNTGFVIDDGVIDDRDVFDDIEIDEGGFLTPVRG